MEGRGISTNNSVARQRGHGGRVALLDVKNTVFDTDIDWKPFAPKE